MGWKFCSDRSDRCDLEVRILTLIKLTGRYGHYRISNSNAPVARQSLGGRYGHYKFPSKIHKATRAVGVCMEHLPRYIDRVF